MHKSAGELAKMVTERRRGSVSSVTSDTNCSRRDVGRRVRTAECRAIDSYALSVILSGGIRMLLTSEARETMFTCPMLEPVIPVTNASFDAL